MIWKYILLNYIEASWLIDKFARTEPIEIKAIIVLVVALINYYSYKTDLERDRLAKLSEDQFSEKLEMLLKVKERLDKHLEVRIHDLNTEIMSKTKRCRELDEQVKNKQEH
jgi:F0F1-type ATP synthase assembly protein I